MEIFFKFVDKLIPEEIKESDSIHYRRYRTLITFQVLVFPTLGFYIVDNIVKNLVVTNISLISFLILSIISIFILYKRNYKLSAHCYTLGLFVGLYGTNAATSFSPTSHLSWFYLFPLIPSVLLGGRAGLNWSILSMISVSSSIFLFKNFGFKYNEYSQQLLYESSLADLIIGPFLVYILSQAALNIREIVIGSLEESNFKINEAYKDKREILSILFHDLNNHLTVSFANLKRVLKTQEYDEKKIEKIEKSLRQMSLIIENVRTLEKVKAGKASLKLEPVNIVEIVEDAKDVFAERLETKKIKIEVLIDKETSHWVIAEKISLANNILYNAISNAIKFSDKDNSIFVKISSLNESSTEIIIEDHGIGMPKSLLDDIFNYNKATSRAGTNGEKGTGFGLPIIKTTLERFQGDIRVESHSREDGYNHSFTKVIISLKTSKEPSKTSLSDDSIKIAI